MDAKFAELIVELSKDAGVELKFRKNYSGRGMMDKETAGICGKLKDLIYGIALTANSLGEQDATPVDEGDELTPEGGGEFLDQISKIRMDNLGHDTIIY